VTEFSIICLSQGAWDAALPTNRQQIMRRAAAAGHQVLFVETSPFLGRSLASAISTRSVRGLVRPDERPPNVYRLVAPNVAPRARSIATAGRVNVRATAFAVRKAARRLPRPVVLWVYDPWAADLIGACGEDAALYDCVDDYGAIGFYSDRARALAARGDAEAARRADIVSVTTRALFERHAAVNPSTQLVPNAADVAHFAPASDRASIAPDVAFIRSPVLGFAGNLMRDKVDIDLLAAVADARPDWTLLLVGPASRDSLTQVQALAERANVTWLGPRPYDELPAYVAAFDIGLCPNLWNDYGRSCFPLKLYEYLAAGKPVVATGTPDLGGMEPDVRLVRGVEQFVEAAAAALGERSEADIRRRQERAASSTWDARASRLVELARWALEARQDVQAAQAVRPLGVSSVSRPV
jgi:glycosyltransferase involved in cell wall biosynthesis